MEIEKTVTFSKNGRECTIKFDFRNNNALKKKMNLGFRIANYPTGFANNKTAAEIGEISFRDAEAKIRKIPNDRECIALKPDIQIPFTKQTGQNCYTMTWKHEDIIVSAKSGKAIAKLNFHSEGKVAGFYVWRSLSDYTVEILSENIELDFGQNETFILKINYELL